MGQIANIRRRDFADEQSKWECLPNLGVFVLSAVRERICNDAGHLKCKASETIWVISAMARFLDTVVAPMPWCSQEVGSFKALSHMQRCIRQAKEGGCDIVAFEKAVCDHGAEFQKAYGWRVKPKHNYTLHLPLQVSRDPALHDCFVGERKHILLKTAAHAINRIAHLERGTLVRCLASQIETVSDPEYLRDESTSFCSGLGRCAICFACCCHRHGWR